MNIDKVLVSFSLLFALGGVSAEIIHIPVGQQGAELRDISRPSRGMAKDEVLERYGAPFKQNAAVGDPPISSWSYPHYTVYFESDTVIHSVLIHRPKVDVNSIEDE